MEQGWPGLAQYIPAVPADWTPRPRTVQDALDQLAARAGGAGFGASFVFRPGGVASPGVYLTWATLMAAVASIDPAATKSIAIDTTIAPAHATADAVPWNVENCTFTSGVTAVAQLIIDDGCHFAYEHLTVDNAFLELAGTTPTTTLAGATAELFFRNNAGMNQNVPGAAVFVAVGAGGNLVCEVSQESLIEAGTTGTLSMTNAGANISLVLTTGSGVQPNAVVGGLGTLNLVLDGSSQSQVSNVQAVGTLVVTNLDPQPTFVFRPAGPAGGNVFTTWALLMAAVALSPGPKTVLIDDTLGGATSTTPGTWNVDQITFTTNENDATSVLHVVTGTVFQGANIYADAGVVISVDGTSDVWAVPAFGQLILRGAATLLCTSTGRFATLANGNELFLFMSDDATLVGDGAHNVFALAGTAKLQIGMTGHVSVATHCIAGAPGATVIVNESAECTFSAQADFTGTLTLNLRAHADHVADQATTPGNWQPNPANVNLALDQLAAPNTVKAVNSGGALGPAATVAQVTGNIAKKRSGVVSLAASVSGLVSAPCTAIVSFLRDGAPLGTPVTAVLPIIAANLNYSIAIDWEDTLPDALNHTYSVQVACTGAGPTTTIAINQAFITATEL